uniref:Uncharacterized protein n=1 Tax=Rhizophora mucronata TaxID=61149 RepID=A0A2P2Q078_RHIMU
MVDNLEQAYFTTCISNFFDDIGPSANIPSQRTQINDRNVGSVWSRRWRSL